MVVVPLNRHDFYVIYQMWQCLVFDEKSDVKMFFPLLEKLLSICSNMFPCYFAICWVPSDGLN